MLLLLAGRTLIRGIGRAVGDFFGVTEASQHGTADSLGWEQVSGIRAAVRVHVCVFDKGGREEGRKEGRKER